MSAIFCKLISRKISSASKSLHDLLLEMPKDRTPLLKVLKASRKLKNSIMNGKYPAGIINLQVLGNGANGGPKCVYLFTDQARYLFNCGEGTQRLAHEHKMKLARLEHVFLTNNRWGMIGGLPGVALTIQDIGIDNISVHGPRGVGQLMEGTRRFVILKDLEIKIVNVESKSKFEDHVMKIEYVPLYSDSTPTAAPKKSELKSEFPEEDDVDYYGNYRGMKGQSMITVDQELSTEDNAKTSGSVCYICEPKKKEGTLLIDKCIERGVPPGPLLGKLKAGMDITLSNGEVVLAKDVRTCDQPGPVFIVVDCPDETYLECLISNPRLNSFQTSELYLIIHFTPGNIMLNPKYVNWMSKFSMSTHHLVLNELCSGYGSEAVHRLQTKLGVVDNQFFPGLREELKSRPDLLSNVSSLTLGETLTKYCLRPGTCLENTTGPMINQESYLKEIEELTSDFPEELKNYKSIQRSPNPQEYPKLTFLGTGSSIPNKTRNVSSILLEINESSSILLDCGEGTTGQLNRFYGPDFEKELKKIKAIYISHLHADHHLGLISVLQARNEKVYLIAPIQINTWLNIYSEAFESISDLYGLIPITDFKLEFLEKKSSQETLNKLLNDLNVKEIRTDYVKHCPNAFGVSIELLNDYKLVYSGDTMPCDNLLKIGSNCNLLIHEATMEDELAAEAKIKMHSTVSQAIQIGLKMNAGFTILTHFSQRYAKVPILNCVSDKVGVAFDNMVVNIGDVNELKRLGNIYNVLKCLFSEDCDEMEVRSAKRRRKKEMDSVLESAN